MAGQGGGRIARIIWPAARGIGESRTALTFLLLINVETPQKEKTGQSDRSQMQGKEWRWLSQQVVIITILNRVFLLNTPNWLFKNKMD